MRIERSIVNEIIIARKRLRWNDDSLPLANGRRGIRASTGCRRFDTFAEIVEARAWNNSRTSTTSRVPIMQRSWIAPRETIRADTRRVPRRRSPRSNLAVRMTTRWPDVNKTRALRNVTKNSVASADRPRRYVCTQIRCCCEILDVSRNKRSRQIIRVYSELIAMDEWIIVAHLGLRFVDP